MTSASAVVMIGFMSWALLLRPVAPARNVGGALDPECCEAKPLGSHALNDL
jgi:hypothetical protein